jgi:hypothetical protein
MSRWWRSQNLGITVEVGDQLAAVCRPSKGEVGDEQIDDRQPGPPARQLQLAAPSLGCHAAARAHQPPIIEQHGEPGEFENPSHDPRRALDHEAASAGRHKALVGGDQHPEPGRVHEMRCETSMTRRSPGIIDANDDPSSSRRAVALSSSPATRTRPAADRLTDVQTEPYPARGARPYPGH